MLINKIIRHFSRLKLSVDKIFNFAFRSAVNAFKFCEISQKPKVLEKKAASSGFSKLLHQIFQRQ
jgi:hypothetical protein